MKKVIVLALISSMCACSDQPETIPDAYAEAPAASDVHNPVPLTSEQRTGRVIYETMCWTCHGVAGRGDGPAVAAGSVGTPPSFHTQDYATSSAERLRRRFAAEIDVADASHPHMQYVASLLAPEHFAEALSFIPALAYPAEIPGSALAGERLFNFRCIGCHGATGEGNGPASESLKVMPPANFTTDTLIAAANWDGLYKRIREGGRAVHGSSMPPWGTVLTEAETWDLVAYLGTFQPGKFAPPIWMK